MLTPDSRPARIGIFYPSDPAGHVPSGIDSFVKGILKFAPPDLEYLLFGATSDAAARPVGRVDRTARACARRHASCRWSRCRPTEREGGSHSPFGTSRRCGCALRGGAAARLNILDFHRIEPLLLFGADPRPKNLLMHQDMSVVRDKNSDILWRHAPGVYEYFERRLLRRTDRVYCVRQSAVDRYRAVYPEIAARIQFIPTWVDTEVFHPAATTAEARPCARSTVGRSGVTPEARLLVFVGRLDRQKDPLLLLDAFARCAATDPSLHLVVIGRRRAPRRGRGRQSPRAAWRSASPCSARWAPRPSPAGCGRPTCSCSRPPTRACPSPCSRHWPAACRWLRPTSARSAGSSATARRDGSPRHATRRALGDAMQPWRWPTRHESRRSPRCVAAIQPYRPEIVLATLYDNHRRQAAERAA